MTAARRQQTELKREPASAHFRLVAAVTTAEICSMSMTYTAAERAYHAAFSDQQAVTVVFRRARKPCQGLRVRELIDTRAASTLADLSDDKRERWNGEVEGRNDLSETCRNALSARKAPKSVDQLAGDTQRTSVCALRMPCR